jgi:hypothetical protein
MIEITFTKKRSTLALLNAAPREGTICVCNIWINDMPPLSRHRECYMEIAVKIPEAKAHSIDQSQDSIHVMIDYCTNDLCWAILMIIYV